MNRFEVVSRELVKSLDLDYEPVGVSLYADKTRIPESMAFTRENLKSYCQALAWAGKGKPLLLEKERMGCKLGTTVLGFEENPEGFLDDGVLEKFGVGLFGSEEASAATIFKSTFLQKGSSQAALIAPLSFFSEEPQVVVFTANSEQVMWLLYAANYDKGGRMDLPQSGGALGGCADITALPLIKGIPNVTFLGLGCRIKSGLDPCHLMMGIAGSTLEMIHKHILDMAKPIAMLNGSRSQQQKA